MSEYKYEDFINNSPVFSLVVLQAPSCPMFIYPKNYKKDATSKSGYSWGLPLAKIPQGSWNADMYTNWMTQNGINILGKNRYERYMVFHEDLIMVYVLFNIGRSFKYIGKYGVFHIQGPYSTTYKRTPRSLVNFLEIYLIDIFIDFSKNTFENKKIIVKFIIHLLNKLENGEKLSNNNDDVKNLFISILRRVYSSKYISEEDKNEIRNKISKVNIFNITQLDLSLEKI